MKFRVISWLIFLKFGEQKMLEKTYSENFLSKETDAANPDPWLALYLDRSIQIDDEAKAALLISMRSKARASPGFTRF